jgi:hypothetical protein
LENTLLFLLLLPGHKHQLKGWHFSFSLGFTCGTTPEQEDWRVVSPRMLCRVALVRTDVLEELSVSFIRVIRIGELGTTKDVTSNISEDTIPHSHRRENLKSYRGLETLLQCAQLVDSRGQCYSCPYCD